VKAYPLEGSCTPFTGAANAVQLAPGRLTVWIALGLATGLISSDPRDVRHGHHTRRSAPDPLPPVDAPTWLVVRDACSQLLELAELPPRADRRAVLVGAREARIADGWRADEIRPRCSFFFAARAGERIMIGIERDPKCQVRP
jgi:hypothetical protein